jgi:hypothetical protein
METAPAPFLVSDRAARRIAEIVASQGGDAALRVEVLGGGCSGFRYEFDLDRKTRPDDLIIERAGARVLSWARISRSRTPTPAPPAAAEPASRSIDAGSRFRVASLPQ